MIKHWNLQRHARLFSISRCRNDSKQIDFYSNRILEEFARQETKRVTIRQLCVFGRNMDEQKLLRSANYLRTQVAIRLAHRIRDFQNLPFIVGMNPHLEMVYNLYWEAFDRFRTYPPVTSIHENTQFCDFCEKMMQKHLIVIPQLVIGLSESMSLLKPQIIDQFFTVMLQSRISRRVIAEHHMETTKHFMSSTRERPKSTIGIVNTRCKPADLVRDCAEKAAALLCSAPGGKGAPAPPKVLVDGDIDDALVYIDDHLSFILFELLKNSMRHTILTHRYSALHKSAPLPPIQVTLASSDADFTFRVSDYGGGIAKKLVPHLWTFSPASRRRVEALQTISIAASQGHLSKVSKCANAVIQSASSLKAHSFSASSDASEAVFESIGATDKSRIYDLLSHGAGVIDPAINLGLGLPMCRLYVEYWGGKVSLYSMEGLGTDVYIKIGKLGNHLENV